MQVRCDEGVANHIGPEPCAGIREDVGEASAGGHIGQPLSRESHIYFWMPTPFSLRKAMWRGARTRAPSQPGEVVDPGRCAGSRCGNREISGLTSRAIGLARIGKVRSRSR